MNKINGNHIKRITNIRNSDETNTADNTLKIDRSRKFNDRDVVKMSKTKQVLKGGYRLDWTTKDFFNSQSLYIL